MFRLFLRSISGSGADLIVLTDVEQMADIIQMPSNVRIRHIRWRDFVFKLEARFNHGNAFASLRDPPTPGGKHGGACYRVSDFKPVLEEIFHVPDKYSWWGWLDNDVLVGNLREIVRRVPHDVDFFNLMGNANDGKGKSHGPFTVFRRGVLPKVFKDGKALKLVKNCLKKNGHTGFHEWGDKEHGEDTSFTYILNHLAHFKSFRVPAFMDCGTDSACIVTMDKNTSKAEAPSENETLAFCHLQCGKKSDFQDYIKSLKREELDRTTMDLLTAKQLCMSKRRGIWKAKNGSCSSGHKKHRLNKTKH
jgi:hypothetical protein